MVLCFRNPDERYGFVEHFEHVVRDLLIEQIALLAIDHADPQAEILQVLGRILEVHLAEQTVVELPLPPTLGTHDRVAADVIEDVVVLAILRRHQTETLKRRFEVGIRALRPDGRTSRVALPDEVRWPYRGV